jgi:hypothetical protein
MFHYSSKIPSRERAACDAVNKTERVQLLLLIKQKESASRSLSLCSVGPTPIQHSRHPEMRPAAPFYEDTHGAAAFIS